MSSLRELDGDLVNHWYILCLQSEVPLDKPLARTIYDVPYVLYRNEKREIHVHVDQCLHRGAPLSKGKCEGGKLRCPYHGWLYDGEGKVCEVPSDGPEASSVKSRNWKLKPIPTSVRDGAVWIWTGDGDPVTSGPTWCFPYANDATWKGYFMVTDFDNEVSHLVQNFMDVPHTVYVHDKWFRKKRMMKVQTTVDVKNGHVLVTYNQPGDSIGFMGRILNPKNAPMVHTDEYIFPNITRVDYSFGDRGFVINSQCTPVTRFKTRVYTWIAYNVGALGGVMKPFFQFYTRKVITQDVEIMEQHGSVLKALGENTYHSTGADELHLAIQKIRQLGIKDRTSPLQVSYKRERDFWI